MTPEKLQSLANAQGRGYLKHWKASSILHTLSRMPEISEDRERLKNYITNCLEMEGFSVDGINIVTDLLRRERLKNET